MNLIQVHNFRKILVILKNDSSGSNHSSKFTLLVVTAFTIKEKKNRAANRAIIQLPSEYLSVRTLFILLLWNVYVLSNGESKSSTTYVLLSLKNNKYGRNLVSMCVVCKWFDNNNLPIIKNKNNSD